MRPTTKIMIEDVEYVITHNDDWSGDAEIRRGPELLASVPGSLLAALATAVPIPMLIWCPLCHTRHLDKGEFATQVHTTHACQKCGLVWKPAKVPTVGVEFLPGYKNEI